jgi:hypothetical protein
MESDDQGRFMEAFVAHQGDATPDDTKAFRSQNATIFDLARLPSPVPRFDLADILLTKGKPTDGNPSSGFEILASCVAEDNRRAIDRFST